jgi:hypothetical protein
MLQTCYARQEPSTVNEIDVEGNDKKHPSSSVVVGSSETDRGTAGVVATAASSALGFEGYLERYDLSGRDQEYTHQQAHRTHHHQSTRSTSSQASSSSGSSSLSSCSQTGDHHTPPHLHHHHHHHQHQQIYPSYAYRKDLHHQRDELEDYAGGDDSGRMPEMDSPGKTSDLSSSMW